MQKVSYQVELKSLNTFAVSAIASQMISPGTVEAVIEALPIIQRANKRLILGGGSNLLFVSNYDGLVIYPQIKGVQIMDESESSVRVSIGASENWHEFVLLATSKGWYGLENLALIPGTVGAAPVQNIGAYGVEIRQFVERVNYVDLETGTIGFMCNQECHFGYRDSFFKRAPAGKYLITSIELNLAKQSQLNLSYQPLAEYFENKSDVSPKQVIERVCEIRREKLPDPDKLANAGSFFKNPVISHVHYEKLKQRFPEVAAYPQDFGVKLAAGWLIEKAGYKGLREGDIGVHRHQALVLVNYGENNGKSIWRLALRIQKDIQERFGVSLEPEVRVIGQL